jgi:hypothetical protein
MNFNHLKHNKIEKKIPPEFVKILGRYKLPPLKEISSSRLEEARKKVGLGYLGLGIWVATTLKRKFLLVVS